MHGGTGTSLTADFEQLEAERFYLGQHTEKRCLIGQRPGEHGLGCLRLRAQARERAQQRPAQLPADADLVVLDPRFQPATTRFRELIVASRVELRPRQVRSPDRHPLHPRLLRRPPVR